MINQGNATFAAAVTYGDVAACNYSGRLAVADINDDGYPDIARSCYQWGDAVAVRINQGDGSFGPETTYASGGWPWGLVLGDFTGHGRIDIASRAADARQHQVLSTA